MLQPIIQASGGTQGNSAVIQRYTPTQRPRDHNEVFTHKDDKQLLKNRGTYIASAKVTNKGTYQSCA
ncbi:hypothetical protein DPMN_158898 [Dreissena polymorpha]|uniref:Uncharacterized protein n=1 Tax=Dreissena polymorpha TaxID=45954 RepID=A0A9D4EK00_DREPO|nr:hypothetical protein DPMN_158898 [Dreissena polymorpha]